MIDIQSLADFYASEIFINNQDVFAGTYINNIRMWKTRNVIDDYKGDGKASFGAEKLEQNFNTLMDAIVKAKPSAAKGAYLKSCTVSSTMGPGVKVSTAKYGV